MSDTPTTISQQQPVPDGVLLRIEGDIDFSRSPKLRGEIMALLERGRPRRLIIDLGGVGYMDSSGIATVVETLQFQRRHGNKLVLCGLQTKVLSMFEIANLDNLFTIVETVDQASQA